MSSRYSTEEVPLAAVQMPTAEVLIPPTPTESSASSLSDAHVAGVGFPSARLPQTAKPRPRKTRCKTGCVCCRLRKKKCGEEKPSCSSCIRMGLVCSWLDHPEFAWRKSRGLTSITEDLGLDPEHSPSTATCRSTADNDNDDNAAAAAAAVVHSRHQGKDRTDSPTVSIHDEIGAVTPDESDSSNTYSYSPESSLISHGQNRPSPTTLRPALSLDTLNKTQHDLLALYIERTCPLLVCAHPSFDNPYEKDVVRMALSDALIMHAVLALGGFLGGADEQTSRLESTRLYHHGQALRGLKSALEEWESESSTESCMRLFLIVVLIFQFEIIRGNPRGAFFQHIRAARHFAQVIYARTDVANLRLAGILLESYTFIDLVSTMRQPPQLDAVESLIHHPVLQEGALKVYPTYGVLLGYASDLFSLVPRIGRLALTREREDAGGFQPSPSSENTRLEFNQLRKQITSWNPPSDSDGDKAGGGKSVFECHLLSPRPSNNGSDLGLGADLDLLAKHDMDYQLAKVSAGRIAQQSLLLLLFSAYYRNSILVHELSQPLLGQVLELCRHVTHTPWANSTYWPLVIAASCAITQEQRDLVTSFLTPVAPLVSSALELLNWVWNSPGDTFGPSGMAKVIETHGVGWCVG